MLTKEKRTIHFARGGKFLKKLWCFVGGEHNKVIWFYQLGLKCELASFRIPLWWPIHITNLVDKTKLSIYFAAELILREITYVLYAYELMC